MHHERPSSRPRVPGTACRVACEREQGTARSELAAGDRDAGLCDARYWGTSNQSPVASTSGRVRSLHRPSNPQTP